MIANCLVKRHDLYDRLKEHVDKSELSYADICEHFTNAKGTTVMPHGTGDFIIFATRLFIKQPIVIIKPVLKTKRKRNDDEHFTIEKVFIDDEDKNLDKSEIIICLIWNGLNYFAPAMEHIICELSDNLNFTRSNQMDALERSVQLLAKLPPSGSKESLGKAILHMRAAKEFLCATQVTTGTTNVTPVLATALPVPLSTRSKVMRPQLFAPCPAKRIRKSGNDDNPENPGEEEDTDASYTGRAEGQCCCGAQFETLDSLDNHVKIEHVQTKNWSCRGTKKDSNGKDIPCGESFNRGDKLWMHYRKKHLNIYRYMCTLKMKDNKDCTHKVQERMGWLYHKEVVHGIGRSPFRCRYCDKPVAQINKIKPHETVCSSSETKKVRN